MQPIYTNTLGADTLKMPICNLAKKEKFMLAEVSKSFFWVELITKTVR